MAVTRRQILGGLGASAAAAWAATRAPVARAADDIVVAGLHDVSGVFDIYGRAMVDALTLGVEEINAAGGLLGRNLRLVNYDTQSNLQLYPQYAQRAALVDLAAVVMGGITSASREAVRPVLDRLQTLYFYNTQYEGGVCDRNTVLTGVTPGQTVAKLVPFAMRRWGKRIYVLAADYNYGQITADWVKKFCQDEGGEIVATDFFPTDVTEFGTTISRIQAAKPDLVMSVLVGGAHLSFYRQWAAAGMTGRIAMASTTFGVGNEHIVLTPAEAEGMLVCYNYFQELETPANRSFVERFHARFGADYDYIHELAMASYQGLALWAEAVRRAGGVERMKVIAALESGLAIDAPSGRVALDPATHHCVLNVHVAELRQGRFQVLETFAAQPPADTAAVCDLIANPDDNQQYVIRV